jgi:hypothetical protein
MSRRRRAFFKSFKGRKVGGCGFSSTESQRGLSATYVDGILQPYSIQEEMVGCIQEKTKYRFLLAHSAPITATSLADKLGYLSSCPSICMVF